MDVFFVLFVGCFVAAGVIWHYDRGSKLPERLVIAAIFFGAIAVGLD